MGTKIKGRDFKKKYNISGIVYHRNEPDFSVVAKRYKEEFLDEVTLPFMPSYRKGEGGSYDLATKIAAKKLGWSESQVKEYMEKRDLCWHECGISKKVLPVPVELNGIIPHTGGISISGYMHAIGEDIRSRYGKVKLYGKGKTYKADNKQVKNALKNAGKRYRRREE